MLLSRPNLNFSFARLKNTKIFRVPLVLQYEAVECGAASLSMLFRYYGLFLPLGEIRQACGVSRDGSNLKNIKNYAIKKGLELKGKRLTCETFLSAKEQFFPCLIFWKYNHFLILEGIGGNDRFFLADPAGGKYSVSKEEFEENFTGITLTGSPNESFQPSGREERQFFTLVTYLKKFKLSIAALLILVIGLIVPNILLPGISGAFVNDFLVAHRFDMGIPIIWLSFIMTLLIIFFELTKANISRRILLRLQRKMTLSIAKKIFSNPYTFYTTRYTGDIADRLLIGMEVSEILVSSLIGTALELLGAILLLPFIILISWQLTAASFVYITITLLATLRITTSLKDMNRSLQIDTGKLAGHSVRMIADLETIKASALEQSYLRKWQDLYSPVVSKAQELQQRMNIFTSVISTLNSFYEYGTIILSGLLVIYGEINLAGFMAFQALRSFFVGPFLGLSNLTTSIQTAEASLGRLTDLQSIDSDPLVHSLDLISPNTNTDIPSEFADSNLRPQRVSSMNSSSIVAENINFKFAAISDNFLTNINFNVRDGEMMTIVGPSGSGKSTLIKLLTGFYLPSSGSVYYGGKKWAEYEDNAIRPEIGYVSQDVTAIRGTVEENILFFRPSFTTKQVRQAAKIAELDHYIDSLPEAYSTELGDDGQGLSGGQLQRLEIARAILKNPKIIFLDEATSSLDIVSEKKVLTNLRNTGFTIVCVAHRLLSAEMSDHVLVLKEGNQMEYGNPAELRTKDSLYKQLLQAEEA